MENIMQFPPKANKKNYHLNQQFYSWLYTKKNQEPELEKIHAHQ